MYRHCFWVVLAGGVVAGCGGDPFEAIPSEESAEQAGKEGKPQGSNGEERAGDLGDGGAAGEENPGGTSGGGVSGGEEVRGSLGEGGEGGISGASTTEQGGAGQGGGGGKSGGNPGSCEPGTFACDGKHLLQCLGDPPGFVPKLDCRGELCDPQQGACLSCIPGEPLGCLDEFTRIVCTAQGTSDGLEPCSAEAPFCDPQAKGVCRACLQDKHCDELPTTGYCDKPVCKDYFCVLGIDVGKPYPELGHPPCNTMVCDVDEEGNPTLSYFPNPKNVPIDDPDGCIQSSCDGGALIQTKLPVGTFCKVGDQPGKCDQAGVCQICLPGESTCQGNKLATCEEQGGKAQWKVMSCNILSEGSAPACDEAACVGVTSIALGDQHTCAILATKRVVCWGDNKYGQSGAAKELPTLLTPTLVQGMEGALQLALGSRHTCALLEDGTVRCWGDNSRGQLGVSYVGSSNIPVLVEELTDVTFLAAGGRTTCAITSDNKLSCWGDGEHGQTFVASGSAGFLSKPTEATGAPSFTKIALGRRHGCGLAKDGTVHCWGDSAFTAGAKFPSTKVGLTGVYTELDVGDFHSCARSPHSFFCWGAPGAKLGSILPQGQFTTVSLLASSGTQLALGANTTCQITKQSGQDVVQCAGLNDHGQLGGPIQNSQNPVVSILPGASKLAVGGDHACAFGPWDPAKPAAGGSALFCWGANGSGQLGTGHLLDATTPQKVSW
ncbi:MAG: hypothetical protein RMJ98_13485 [Myxococcales bacterium]|nr:hypothetical protein [Polyangiaceae bacterium]MDW8250302.1 hypothetical protein [Myxococcales bacterium]